MTHPKNYEYVKNGVKQSRTPTARNLLYATKAHDGNIKNLL